MAAPELEKYVFAEPVYWSINAKYLIDVFVLDGSKLPVATVREHKHAGAVLVSQSQGTAGPNACKSVWQFARSIDSAPGFRPTICRSKEVVPAVQDRFSAPGC